MSRCVVVTVLGIQGLLGTRKSQFWIARQQRYLINDIRLGKLGIVSKNPWAGAIRQAIKRSGMTVPELADQSGIAKSLLYNWRNPDSFKPNEDNLQKLADFLKVPISSLKGTGVPEHSGTASADAPHVHRHFTALHERASAEQRIWIAQLMLETLEANIRDLREVLAPASEDSSAPAIQRAAQLPPNINIAEIINPSGKDLPLGKPKPVVSAKKAKRRHG